MTKSIKSTADLTPDPRNANVGTERGSYILDDSLTECGAGRSIVADRDGVVIAGNKFLQTAADRGLPVRVVQTDGKELVVVQRTDLDLDGEGEEKRRAQRLAIYDNRAGQVSLEWDGGVMAELLAEDGDIFEGLFFDEELGEILQDYTSDLLSERSEQIKPKEMFRVLISVPIDSALDVKAACETIADVEGAEVVYGAN